VYGEFPLAAILNSAFLYDNQAAIPLMQMASERAMIQLVESITFSSINIE